MKKISSKNLAIAVDIGGTNLRTAIVNKSGKIIAKKVSFTPQKGRSGAIIAEKIREDVEELLKVVDKNKIRGIGVCIASPIDLERGGAVNPPNIGFKFVPVVQPLEKKLNLPVKIMGDCKSAILGEKYFGAGKKVDNLVYVTISSGIGAGVIANGNIISGKDGNAGEVGHMIIDTIYSLPCRCKRGRGHWEAYASGINIPKFFKAWAEKNNLDIRFPNLARDIFDSARKKDKNADKFMEELGRINGAGFSNIITAYNPELIVLSGSVALNNFEIIMKYAKKNIDRFLTMPKITRSKLGDNAPLLGAAASVFHEK
jgi:glucokinase